MIMKRHNHTPHTNPRHREEQTQNTDSHVTPKGILKYSKTCVKQTLKNRQILS